VPAGPQTIITDCSQYSRPDVITEPKDTTKKQEGEDDFFE